MTAIPPTKAPNVEYELARLANNAMQDGADPADTTAKLHDMIGYLRSNPKMAEHATNALADGVASIADVSRLLYPHAKGYANAQRANVQPTDDEAAGLPRDPMGVGGKIVSHLANIAQGVPGVEAAQAGVRSVLHGQSYRDALKDIDAATEQIPGGVKFAERLAGAIPMAAVLPASPAAAGAIIGGADMALSADPDKSLTNRAITAPIGAAVGAITGKATDTFLTGARAALSKNPASLLLQKQAERAASAKGLYDAALAEGRAHEATPALKSFLSDPDVQDIVGSLQQTRQFANVPAESPEMLDAIYKTLSDQAKQAQKGLDALNPTKANQGRFRLSDIKSKQRQLLDALGKPGEKPPLTLDVAPETYDVAPRVAQAERETLQGPINVGSMRETTTPPSDPTLRQALRDFPQPAIPPQMQGPAGPAFQLRGQSEKVIPGVTIETPAMTVQTAPGKQLPAMMPTYAQAVKDYAQRTQEIEAIQRGYEALRAARSGNLPTAKNLVRKTPEAFAEWAASASPSELAGARKGVLGGAKMTFHPSANPLKGFGLLPALGTSAKAGALLRASPTTYQVLLDELQNLGLLTAGGQATNYTLPNR